MWVAMVMVSDNGMAAGIKAELSGIRDEIRIKALEDAESVPEEFNMDKIIEYWYNPRQAM